MREFDLYKRYSHLAGGDAQEVNGKLYEAIYDDDNGDVIGYNPDREYNPVTNGGRLLDALLLEHLCIRYTEDGTPYVVVSLDMCDLEDYQIDAWFQDKTADQNARMAIVKGVVFSVEWHIERGHINDDYTIF